MHRAVLATCLIACLGAPTLFAQEAAMRGEPATASSPNGELSPLPRPISFFGNQTATSDAGGLTEAPWQTAWGVVGLRIIPAGPKVAPNGEEYHPCFSLDLDFNFWLWRSQGIYLFGDMRFWGEKPEYGVTNGRDGGLGFSKREYDLEGGPAWNYYDSWEARVSGYCMTNLNRGTNPIDPTGEVDGALLENRYYLSDEYNKLGQTGFDVTRATFLSAGWYPTKDMVGNNGQEFEPGVMVRAYLTYDLWDWPSYAFCDTTLITDRTLQPRLLLMDVGVAVRPLSSYQQWEFRFGVENTADLQEGSVLNLWYVAIRCIF